MGICGEATNGKQAVESARVLHPDVVVLDISMAGDEQPGGALGIPSLAWDAES
jgi:DNA-binding NarL/FixJ family response regulator